LWVFTEIPYATLKSHYGAGGPFDFISRLMYVIDKPIFILLLLGFLFLIISLFRNPSFRNRKFFLEEIILIWGTFSIYFLAHSIFWWKGLFNSMGLARVLIDVMPLIAIITLYGFNMLTGTNIFKNKKINLAISLVIILIIIVYPFANGKNGVNWIRDMKPSEVNTLVDNEVTPYITEHYGERLVYYQAPYLGMALEHDYFNQDVHQNMWGFNGSVMQKDAIVVWDDWFSRVECGIEADAIYNDPGLQVIKDFQKQSGDRLIRYILAEKRSIE
jgi:hypothetical protein